ncbi:hypothetical protein Dsin_012911 [Dipteronia sinensis]|uniref:Secreted protein n=1 Tax=Dipteronia sinensis TaxID=43782 RepID=A0AAE0AJ54_9ROSI|nr:hypothetical protein Dsin_012911 [Dipteronia sinensis]
MSKRPVFMMAILFLSCMQRCSTVFRVPFTLTVVRVRSRTNRRIREPPQRFRRRDDLPKAGAPGQGPRPAAAGGAAPPART